MWRDPYGSGIGERLLVALVSLIVAAMLIKFLAVMITPLIPVLFTVAVVAAGLLWIFRRRY